MRSVGFFFLPARSLTCVVSSVSGDRGVNKQPVFLAIQFPIDVGEVEIFQV